MSEPEPGICAVIPAAGRGSRLGVDRPKIFVPLSPTQTIWDSLRDALVPVCPRRVLILSPEGTAFLQSHPDEFPDEKFLGTNLACQDVPRGMGDAIFGAVDFWRDAESLLVVWGDQFNLATTTLRACVALQKTADRPSLVLPLVRMPQPYVEYSFDSENRLTAIRQSREGDVCQPQGWADIGVFLVTGGAELIAQWEIFQAKASRGSATGEINFLPFLVHLSSEADWPVLRHAVTNPDEALGINTPQDLARAREIVRQRKRS